MVSPFNKANVFDLTHEHLLTCNMGQLIPVELVEVVPGDTFKQHTDMFMRLEALIAPIMHRCDVKFWSFYVPNRTIMDGWEGYITGGPDGTDDTVKPYMVAPEGGYAPGSLADYLGLPLGVGGYKHSALPIRMYQKIYNEWFRDENLIDEVALSTADGLDTTTSLDLQNVAWEKDYFTNALPTPQRGPASYLPFSVSAPVVTDGTQPTFSNGFDLTDRGLVNTLGEQQIAISGSTSGSSRPLQFGNNTGLRADLSQATSVTVNQMRLAFQVQKFLEKNMRGGARLVEWTLSHFGVRIPDGRLQRSEFLGGGRSPVVISPVEQTSSTDATSPQGNLAGRGSSAQRTHKWMKSFVEQGFVMTLMTVIPRTLYSQGLHRLWSRETRYDEYLPVFAHLGEQEVKAKELCLTGDSSYDESNWGFNDRFSELRHIPSTAHGQFRAGESLDYWTMARQFDLENPPQLNGDFVTADPTRRVFAVTDESVDTIEVQVMHHLKAIRPLPKYGNPGLIDHD